MGNVAIFQVNLCAADTPQSSLHFETADIVMTSTTAGYLNMTMDRTTRNSSRLTKLVVVPGNTSVMISFKERWSPWHLRAEVGVYIQGFGHHADRNAYSGSAFARLLKARAFRVEVVPQEGASVTFLMYFSYFSEGQQPQRLPGGLWNCSVPDYPSFLHHLTCNLKTECQDERDETEDCPFSSPDCRGLLDLCDRCYTILANISVAPGNYLKVGNNHCGRLGGVLAAPKCVWDWPTAVVSKTGINADRVNRVVTGVHTLGTSVPNMYRYAPTDDNRHVVHHMFSLSSGGLSHRKVCFFSFAFFPGLNMFTSCDQNVLRTSDPELPSRVICEVQKNKTEGSDVPLKAISLSSSHIAVATRQPAMVRCTGGHVTYTFILCGGHEDQVCGQNHTVHCRFSQSSSFSDTSASLQPHILSVPLFSCADQSSTLSYAFVCNYVFDCRDRSDEVFCRYPPCTKMFTCSNGQCLSYDEVCDNIFHCWDQSDEASCIVLRRQGFQFGLGQETAIIDFDSVREFTSVAREGGEPCPDSHYMCPTVFQDCLPVYTRCNGMKDCLGGEDEWGCEDVKCPGFFRCRRSTICVDSDHLCDGWPHCPMNDDEMVCGLLCPAHCLCQGHTFLCLKAFSAALFPHLRYLNASGSGMTLSDLRSNSKLLHLLLTRCSLTVVPYVKMLSLRHLDLSDNQLQHVNLSSFLGLPSLRTLCLSSNPVTTLQAGTSQGTGGLTLRRLDLSDTALTLFDAGVLSHFPGIQQLHLNGTLVTTITHLGFRAFPELRELHLKGSPVTSFPPDLFRGLSQLAVITADNYRLCCRDLLPDNVQASGCHAPKTEVSSCEDLLLSWTYRGFLWLTTALSLTGNAVSFCARVREKGRAASSGFHVFVINLTVADFLMGVYMSIIGAADERFRGRYLFHDHFWKHSVPCQLAGFLSLLSSEVSALVIWVITLDRFLVLHFPFSTLRFSRASAAMACVLIWLTGGLLAVLPLLPMTAHWQFYSKTSICIPLPVTREKLEDKVYAVSVLILLNFVLFLLIASGQAAIYWSVQRNMLKTSKSKLTQDMTIARRLISVAITDFLCWFPVGLLGILALAGVAIPAEVNVALAVFILPMNSAVNPFMYTFNTVAEKRRKANEAKLVKWLKSQADVATSP